MGTYNFKKKSSEEQSRIAHHDGAVKSDGWINVLTGLGLRGRDKNVHAQFRLEKIFEQAELDQLYRSDGVTRRIMDIIPAPSPRGDRGGGKGRHPAPHALRPKAHYREGWQGCRHRTDPLQPCIR